MEIYCQMAFGVPCNYFHYTLKIERRFTRFRTTCSHSDSFAACVNLFCCHSDSFPAASSMVRTMFICLAASESISLSEYGFC